MMQQRHVRSITVSAPGKVLRGSIRLPASKSISNRLLMIRALSGIPFDIVGLSEAEDTQLLTRLISLVEKSTGRKKPVEVDAGMAGTVLRFLAAWLAMKPGRWVLTGSDRMKDRPIGILVEALRMLGASIDYLAKPGFPPLLIRGNELHGRELVIDPGISSQFASALLMIAPLLPSGMSLVLKGRRVSTPYLRMTIHLMEASGIRIREFKHHIRVAPGSYKPPSFTVEADWSAAAPWYEAAAFCDEVDFYIRGLSSESLQGDAVLPEIFRNFGVATEFTGDGIRLTRFRKKIDGFYFDFNANPDIAQAVIATCAGMRIRGRFEGLSTLQIKETDRLKAMKSEIRKLGIIAEISTQGDSFLELDVKPASPPPAPSLTFDTFGDHRMAMALAPLCLKEGPLRIVNPDVVGKSYPQFWSDLASAGFTIS